MITGQCLCRSGKIEVDDPPNDIGVCHCKMCQRWSGFAFAAIEVPDDRVRVTGDYATYQSSDTGTRSFCRICGSTLWFRTIGEAAYCLPIGMLDGADLYLDHEIFIDRKSPAWSIAGKHQRETEDEVFARLKHEGDQP